MQYEVVVVELATSTLIDVQRVLTAAWLAMSTLMIRCGCQCDRAVQYVTVWLDVVRRHGRFINVGVAATWLFPHVAH